jgi:hypothetical protein
VDAHQLIHMKAEAFDRIVEVYRELEKGSGLTMSSWVLFSEALEEELEQLQRAASGESP